MKAFTTLAICCLRSVASAQDYNVRSGEVALKGSELERAVVGQPIVFFDNGESRYSAGGSYSYTYFEGQTAYGSFELMPDGRVCVAFQNGFSRCDKFVQNERGLVLLTDDGERYPVR